MSETEQRSSDLDVRILQELTIVADHILSMENLLREMLVKLDNRTGSEIMRVP